MGFRAMAARENNRGSSYYTETLSANMMLAIVEGNPPVAGGFPAQMTNTQRVCHQGIKGRMSRTV